jgi:hypothetical protein
MPIDSLSFVIGLSQPRISHSGVKYSAECPRALTPLADRPAPGAIRRQNPPRTKVSIRV